MLILNLSDASAAGTNLTAANHVIFVSPLHAPSQHSYDAANTQAIGRIRRYGQTQTCHVYRLIVQNTIDQEVHELRRGEKEKIDPVLNPVDSVLDGLDASAIFEDDDELDI